MFTLQRRKVKDKLDILGRQLSGEFQNAGLELVMHLSDDHPSLWNNKKVDTQWLFFSRDHNAEREISEIIDTEKTLAATLVDPTPLYRHIFLGVSVNESCLEIGIRLHHDAWVDRKNLLALLGSDEKRQAFREKCQALTGQIGFGVHQNELTPMSELTDAALQSFESEFDTSSKGWMFLGARLSKDAVVIQGAAIQDTILQTMAQLVPLYRYIAWTPQNDALSIEHIVEQKKQERQATHEELLHEQQEREEKQRQLVAKRQQEQEEKKQELLDEQAWREQERAKRRALAIARREKEAALQAESRTSRFAADKVESPVATEAPIVRKDEVQEARPEAPARSESVANTRTERPAASSANRNDQRPQRSDRFAPKGKASPKAFDKKRDHGKNSSPAPKAAPPVAAKPIHVSDERKADIQVGDKVAVVSGFLKDREGIVQSIDEKGDLKVSFGMLSSRVARGDVQGLGPVV